VRLVGGRFLWDNGGGGWKKITPRGILNKFTNMADDEATAAPPPPPPAPSTTTSSTSLPPQRKKKGWFPLESNPAVMQKYVQSLGLLPTFYTVNDVLSISTEDWALDMVLPPVLAVLFLFPIKPSMETFRREEDARIKE